jgi:hypothetical protein
VTSKISREAQRSLDVPGLGSFVPTGRENNHFTSSLLKIHPVTRAVIYSQFRNTFTNWFHVAGVSTGEPFESRLDAGPSLKIAEPVQPLSKEFSLANFNH